MMQDTLRHMADVYFDMLGISEFIDMIYNTAGISRAKRGDEDDRYAE